MKESDVFFPDLGFGAFERASESERGRLTIRCDDWVRERDRLDERCREFPDSRLGGVDLAEDARLTNTFSWARSRKRCRKSEDRKTSLKRRVEKGSWRSSSRMARSSCGTANDRVASRWANSRLKAETEAKPTLSVQARDKESTTFTAADSCDKIRSLGMSWGPCNFSSRPINKRVNVAKNQSCRERTWSWRLEAIWRFHHVSRYSGHLVQKIARSKSVDTSAFMKRASGCRMLQEVLVQRPITVPWPQANVTDRFEKKTDSFWIYKKVLKKKRRLTKFLKISTNSSMLFSVTT